MTQKATTEIYQPGAWATDATNERLELIRAFSFAMLSPVAYLGTSPRN